MFYVNNILLSVFINLVFALIIVGLEIKLNFLCGFVIKAAFVYSINPTQSKVAQARTKIST